MNKKWLFIIITLLCAFVTPLGYSVQNPSLNNPAGATTIPPSYYGNNLVNTSNPIDSSGNQIITGNVRQGKSFQGNVPYSSPSSFNSNLGSASLNSFMRDSTGPEDIGRYQNTSAAGSVSGTNYQPYHLPSATVTTMSPNRSGAIGQVNTRANNNAQYIAGSQTQQNQPAISTQGTSAPAPTFWQLYNPGLAGTQTQYNTLSEPRQISQNPRQSSGFPTENQPRSPNQNPIYQQDQTVVSQQYLQQARQNSQQAPNPINQGQQTQTVSRYDQTEPVPAVTQQQMAANSELIPAGKQYTSVPYQPGNTQQPVPATNNTTYQSYAGRQQMPTQQYQQQDGRIPNTQQDIDTTRAIAQIQKQLDDLIRSIDSRLQNPTDYTSQYSTTVQPPHSTSSGQASGGMTNLPIGQSSPRQTGNSYQPGQSNQDFSIPTGSSRLQDIMKTSDGSQTQSYQNQMSPSDRFNQLSQAEVSARARQIMGPHTDYESFSQAKCTQLYRAAEGHLSIGRFHQAADAFTLAAIYNPDDPLCYAGRGHALFAAGEFISSALFLIRAIEIDPEYVNTNVDLVELLGNAEDLNTKITELNKWLQKSNAPGLGFLLSYVYYHTGRLNEARQVMDIVSRELPQSRAAVALKMAIDFKLKTQK